jgi:hypothetical protein
MPSCSEPAPERTTRPLSLGLSALVVAVLVVQWSASVVDWATAPVPHAGPRVATHLLSEAIQRAVRVATRRDTETPTAEPSATARSVPMPGGDEAPMTPAPERVALRPELIALPPPIA